MLTTTGVADPVDLGDPAHIADVAVGMRPQGLTVTPEIPVGQRPVQLVFNLNGERVHVLNQGDLSDSGTQVPGYVTDIDATTRGILGEWNFTQDNTVPSGIALAQKGYHRFYVSCLQTEKEVLRFGGGAHTILVFSGSGGHPNLKSRLAGIAGGGDHFPVRYLFIADLGENKLVRIKEDRNGTSHTHAVWLGGNSSPVYVAVSPVFVNDAAQFVYTSNPSTGTVSVIDVTDIKD